MGATLAETPSSATGDEVAPVADDCVAAEAAAALAEAPPAEEWREGGGCRSRTENWVGDALADGVTRRRFYLMEQLAWKNVGEKYAPS